MKTLPFHRTETGSHVALWRRERLAMRAAMVSMLALLLSFIGLVALAAAAVHSEATGLRAIAAGALAAAVVTVAWARSVRRRLADFDRELAPQEIAQATRARVGAPRRDRIAAPRDVRARGRVGSTTRRPREQEQRA